jgi:energy-coupling factor transport system permease protein
MAQTLARGLRYRNQDTVIHRLDPIVKLLLSGVLLTLSLLSSSLGQVALVGIFLAVPIIVSKGVRRTGKLVLMSIGFGAFIFVADWLSKTSLEESFVLFAKFLAIMASASLFFLTTSPDELEQVMRRFGVPKDFVFAFVTAVRFVPVLLLDLTQIMDAQRSRGLVMDGRNPIRRIRNFTPVLIPMVVNAVIRSEQLAEVLESRGYGAVKKPTLTYTMKLRETDYRALVVIVVVFSGLFLVIRLHGLQ